MDFTGQNTCIVSVFTPGESQNVWELVESLLSSMVVSQMKGMFVCSYEGLIVHVTLHQHPEMVQSQDSCPTFFFPNTSINSVLIPGSQISQTSKIHKPQPCQIITGPSADPCRAVQLMYPGVGKSFCWLFSVPCCSFFSLLSQESLRHSYYNETKQQQSICHQMLLPV